MESRRILLRFAERARLAVVREPCGADELEVGDTSTFAAIGLVDRLLVYEGEGCLAPGRAADLSAHDRDQVLAGVHGLCFGDRIVSTLRCGACEAPFDFSFEVSALAAHIAEAAAPDPDLKPPSGADEIAVSTLPPQAAALELARRGLGAPDAPDAAAAAAFAERLARGAPVISVDLDAPCPECGRANAAPFDIQGYLLGRILGARAGLVREVHRLASAYGWSASEIIGLRSSLRRTFVALVDAERPSRRVFGRVGA